MRGEDGGIDGIVNAVVDTTDRVLSERRLRTLSRMGERTDPSSSVEAACRKALESLAENRADAPFALIYLSEDDARSARRVACAGVEVGMDAAPDIVALDTGVTSTWPLAEAQDKNESFVITPRADLALPSGVWPEPVAEAIVAPVTMSSDTRACAFLVAGVNPRRRIDAAYRSFFELAAGHVGTGITTARAYEDGHRHRLRLYHRRHEERLGHCPHRQNDARRLGRPAQLAPSGEELCVA